MENLKKVMEKTKVIVNDETRYMHVDNDDGTIVIGKSHLQESSKLVLYLDIVHELVHVRQQSQGLDLYDKSHSYVDRPTEIEAYKIAVKEAKRLGLSDEEIFGYLLVEWISDEEHRKLASSVGITRKI